jgi:hypothetical protein
MSVSLVFAAALAATIAIAHSWLGERYIIIRLLRRSDLPKLLGGDAFTKQTIRFAWHLTTVAWWGFAAVLYLLSGSPADVADARGVLLVIGLTFVASALLSFVFTGARHLSWIVFLSIAALCAAAAL